MERLSDRLALAARDLESCGASFSLVGALAVGVRAATRFTRDVDVAVSVDGDRESERLILDMQARGWRIVEAFEHEVGARLAMARLAGPGGRDAELDLLFASSGIEREIVAASESLEVLGTRLRVASIAHLIALKVLAADERKRPQDAIDLRALLQVAATRDLDAARDALREIARRGFHRGKDLDAELRRHLAAP